MFTGMQARLSTNTVLLLANKLSWSCFQKSSLLTGEHGRNIHTRADQCGVIIKLSHSVAESDSILLRGPQGKCSKIKQDLRLLAEGLEAKEEARKRQSYCKTIRLDSQLFSVLIGRKGVGIGICHGRYNVHIELHNGDGTDE